MNDKQSNRVWAVVTTVLAIVFSYVAFTIWDRLEAGESKSNSSVVTEPVKPDKPEAKPAVDLELIEPSIMHVACCMVNHVHPGVWGERMAKDFRQDRIRDSAGRGIPRKITRKLSSYAAEKAAQGVTIRHWWKNGGMNTAHCMANWGWTGGSGWCMKNGNRPGVVKINREITKVTVICSGAAVIGSVKGGGWVGAGRGGLGCVWARWATKASQ